MQKIEEAITKLPAEARRQLVQDFPRFSLKIMRKGCLTDDKDALHWFCYEQQTKHSERNLLGQAILFAHGSKSERLADCGHAHLRVQRTHVSLCGKTMAARLTRVHCARRICRDCALGAC